MDTVAAEQEIRLRANRPGDVGWIIHRHAVLYAREQGWHQRVEALAVSVMFDFLNSAHPDKERCWVAEREGEIVGSIMLTHKTDEVGQLRMLYVEPHVRGRGLGDRLMQTGIDFGREAGYKSVILWTTDNLHVARNLYVKKGFRLVQSEPHNDFGAPVRGEIWSLSFEQG